MICVSHNDVSNSWADKECLENNCFFGFWYYWIFLDDWQHNWWCCCSELYLCYR